MSCATARCPFGDTGWAADESALMCGGRPARWLRCSRRGAATLGHVDAHRGRGVARERGGGPDRPALEVAAAVGADVVEALLDAVGAERALVGADPRVGGVGRQVAVAALAG